jgi:hypothetical protein
MTVITTKAISSSIVVGMNSTHKKRDRHPILRRSPCRSTDRGKDPKQGQLRARPNIAPPRYSVCTVRDSDGRIRRAATGLAALLESTRTHCRYSGEAKSDSTLETGTCQSSSSKQKGCRGKGSPCHEATGSSGVRGTVPVAPK